MVYKLQFYGKNNSLQKIILTLKSKHPVQTNIIYVEQVYVVHALKTSFLIHHAYLVVCQTIEEITIFNTFYKKFFLPCYCIKVTQAFVLIVNNEETERDGDSSIFATLGINVIKNL